MSFPCYVSDLVIEVHSETQIKMDLMVPIELDGVN